MSERLDTGSHYGTIIAVAVILVPLITVGSIPLVLMLAGVGVWTSIAIYLSAVALCVAIARLGQRVATSRPS